MKKECAGLLIIIKGKSLIKLKAIKILIYIYIYIYDRITIVLKRREPNQDRAKN
jgi:hypothetical protein